MADLISAAKDGDTSRVLRLLNNGADPNVQNERLETPIFWAACCGHANICYLLIQKGAKVDAANEFQLTPLHGAADTGRSACIRILVGRYVCMQVDFQARIREGGGGLGGTCPPRPLKKLAQQILEIDPKSLCPPPYQCVCPLYRLLTSITSHLLDSVHIGPCSGGCLTNTSGSDRATDHSGIMYEQMARDDQHCVARSAGPLMLVNPLSSRTVSQPYGPSSVPPAQKIHVSQY